VKIWVEQSTSDRSGGLGEAKTWPICASCWLQRGQEKRFTQVLWLDAAQRKFVKKVGTMNMFCHDDEVITRRSAAASPRSHPGFGHPHGERWGMKMSERFLPFDSDQRGSERRLKEALEQEPQPSLARGPDHLQGRTILLAGERGAFPEALQ